MAESLDGLSGLKDFLKRLELRGGRAVGRAAIAAGIKELKSEIKAACPGTIAQEVGSRQVRTTGQVLTGVVGLGVAGAEAKVDDPHGHFLAAGTKFIEARHFVRDAIAGAIPAVEAAMTTAAAAKLAQLKEANS